MKMPPLKSRFFPQGKGCTAEAQRRSVEVAFFPGYAAKGKRRPGNRRFHAGGAEEHGGHPSSLSAAGPGSWPERESLPGTENPVFHTAKKTLPAQADSVFL